ncbi:MAG TPA: hypothetical protein ENJ32_05475 [Crenotrichaceae bacterium]|nr:hypothetical protein [Crenotrichaceae bacterium]
MSRKPFKPHPLRLVVLGLMTATTASAMTVTVNDQLVCNVFDSLYWDGRLAIRWLDQDITPPAVTQPEPPDTPFPTNVPPVILPPTPPVQFPPLNPECPAPEANVRVTSFADGGLNQDFTLGSGTVLTIPFNSGPSGTVKTFELGDASQGQSFQKVAIFSQCPGVLNPGAGLGGIDSCVVTQAQVTFQVISGASQTGQASDQYQCIFRPNKRYYLTILPLNIPSHPLSSEPPTNPCEASTCAVNVLIQ